jgi:O-antigen/teichoic acid export membrane protein/GT2 family glycosyltransferase
MSEPPRPACTAIVPTLDRPAELEDCLRSLAAADPPFAAVIVADQSATPALRGLVESYGATYLHLEQRGLSRARNTAVARATTPWLYFPDDDCTVANDVLVHWARALAADPDAGFVVAHVRTPDGRPIMLGMDGHARALRGPRDVITTVMSPGLFVAARVFERCQGFDETFGVGAHWPSGEESDLLFRALASGEHGRYVPDALVTHPDQFAVRDEADALRRARQYGRGWGALFAKHAATPAGAVYAELQRHYERRALAGSCVYALTLRLGRMRRQWQSWTGRREGWREWRAQHAAATGDTAANSGSPMLTNTAAVVSLRAGNLLARLGLLFVLARHLPPATFGLVVFALSVSEIAKVVADFGMDTLAIREYAREQAREAYARFAAGLAGAKLAIGTLAYAGLVGYLFATQSREQAAIGAVVGITALTSLLVNFSLDWFQARLRVGRVLAPVLAVNALLTALAVLLIPRLHDLKLLAALFPAIELGTGLVLLARLAREGLLARPLVAWDGVAALARRCVPIALTAVTIMTYSRMDVLVLAKRLGSAAVGQYGVAFRLTEPFQIAAAAFGLSVFSRFSALFHHAEPASLRATASRYLLLTLGYGGLVALGLCFVAPPLLERFLPAYVASIPILRILAAALVFRTLAATLSGILQGAGRFRLLTGLALWNLVASFALLQWFIPRFAAPGAALVLLIVEASNALVQTAIVARMLSTRGRVERHA